MKSKSSKTRGHRKTLQRMFMAWFRSKSNRLPKKSLASKTSPMISKKILVITLRTVRHLQKLRAIYLRWKMFKIRTCLRKSKSHRHHRSQNRLRRRNSRFHNSLCKSKILYLQLTPSTHQPAPMVQEVSRSSSPQHRLRPRHL